VSPVVAVDVDALVAPVAGGAPAGADLRYQPIYDEIKANKRTAESDPTDLNPWKKVAALAAQGLTRSKDLQLAIWLIEPLARLDGFPGVASGLVVLRRLLVEHWEGLYPALDPEEADPASFRRSLVNFVDKLLPSIVKTIPLTAPPSAFGLLHHEVTEKTGDEKKALMDEGWPSAERFEEALQNSTLPYLESTLAAILMCETELAALQAAADQRFNGADSRGEPVSLLFLKETLATCHWIVERPAKKKREAQTGGQPGVAGTAGPGSSGPLPGDGSGGQVWSEALNFTRENRVDGLRLLQAQVASATGGRDRFLKELQLGELCLEAGVYALAYPIFDELAKTIDARQLEAWEDQSLISRVWQGLVTCCGLIGPQNPAAGARGREIQDRLSGLAPGPAAPPPEP
jgi:type VI secretion system protein ImpA